MARPAHSQIENDNMRERLATQALALFREDGVEGVSLRKLAKRVGVSHTLIYSYFENKDSLFTAIRSASLSVLHQSLCAADKPGDNGRERLSEAMSALVNYGMQHSKEYRFIFYDEQPNLKNNEPLLQLRHKIFNHIVQIASEAQEMGYLKQDPRTWTHLAWATIHGILTLNQSSQLLEGRPFHHLLEPAKEMLLPTTDSNILR